MALWAIILLVVVVAAIALFLLFSYNGLIRFRNQMKNAWAQIDVQLKRRHDLIPNLVETAKGYMQHERETLEAVTNARNLAQAAVGTGVAAQAKAEGALGGFLGRLLAVAENYPDLKANQNFLALQEELASTENKIAFSEEIIRLFCHGLMHLFGYDHVRKADHLRMRQREEHYLRQIYGSRRS